MQTGQSPNLTSKALTLTVLFLASVMIGLVSAEVPDGDGTTGIDRNPTPSEQDGVSISRDYDGQNVMSKDTLTINNGWMMTQAGTSTTGDNTYSKDTGEWTATGETVAGEGPMQYNSHDSGVRQSNLDVQVASIGGSGGGVTIDVTDASDGLGGDSITMTLQNWYGAIDRSTAHGVGTGVKAAGLDGCQGASTVNVQMCGLNQGENGIDAGIPTQVAMMPNEGTNTFSYGIMAGVESAALTFGIDYETTHSFDVYVNGVHEEIGNTKSVSVLDDVVLRCKAVAPATSCDESEIQLGMPSAWKSTSIVALGGDPAILDDNYNATVRLAVFSDNIVKLTFGTAAEHQSNITAQDGVFYDPSISFLKDEPGVRIGQIEDGGASWCDSWWFLAKCGDSLSFDGDSSDGMDGLMLHYKVPVEAMISQDAWGGYDKAQLVLHHGKQSAEQCFNGEIQTYVVPPSQISEVRTKKNLLQYAITGDYYSMSEPTSAYSTGTTRVGTSTADYCFGPGTQDGSTTVDIGRIAQMTGTSPYTEYQNGFYDIDSQMYEFYVIVSIEASTDLNANADNKLDEFAIDTGADTGSSQASSAEPGLVLQNTVARNPLQDFAPNEYRSTSTTNQINPAFGSSYVMYYSGITPSDNVVAGTNLTAQGSTPSDNWGGIYYGTQNGEMVRKPTNVAVHLPTGEAFNDSNIGLAQTNTTALSTIECGLAALGGSPVSATIEIFTSVDTSEYYGYGVNGSNYPATEPVWKAYGALTTNSSRWLQAPPTQGPASSFWAVDNSESNTGSATVSFTGAFLNSDNYKATCTFVYHSSDIGANNATTVTLTSDYFFTAAFDGNYVGSGGSDVSEDDDGFLDDFEGWDYVIIGIALTLIGLGLYMWSSGSGITSWFDDRLAMMLLGVAILHAWVAAMYGPDGTGDLSEDTAMAVGTLGYLVMALAAFLWGNATSNQGERNFRFALGGLYLIVIGVPTALTGLLNVESEFLQDAMWTFPVYEAVAGLGAFIGIILLGSASAGLYRRGM